METSITIKAKIVAIQDGQYTVIVFENLMQEYTSDSKFVTCTKLPNWDYTSSLNIGDIGYLQYKSVIAGTNYYNQSVSEHSLYKYDNCYFINFIKEKDTINEKEFNFS